MYPVKTLGLCVNVEPSTVSYARHNMSGNVINGMEAWFVKKYAKVFKKKMNHSPKNESHT